MSEFRERPLAVGHANIFLYLIFGLLLAFTALPAQAVQDTVVADSTQIEPLNPFSALWRSAILPGWGQLYQERLWPATIFYASAFTFYYRGFFHLYRYHKVNDKKKYYEFRYDISTAAFIHILNLIDAADAGFRLKPKGWQGGLLADEPLKSPWGATLRSAILPGWGQWYNESYLKAFVYAGISGYLFYKIREADILYRDTNRTRYRDRRSLYSWYFGLAYFIGMADAHAGAYLYKFDEAVKLAVTPGFNREYVYAQVFIYF